jgi:hypothetical protein
VAFGCDINKFLGAAIPLQIPSQVTKVSVDELCTEALIVGGRPELLVGAPP